jgi:acyl-CoA synthetase (AMP-forming)/AMP-acid ligase II
MFPGFQRALQDSPQRTLFSFLDENGNEKSHYTFFEFNLKARAIGFFLLHDLSLKPGDRVLLLFSPSLEYSVALVGCLFAGIIAVPVQVPDPARLEHDVARLNLVAQASGAVAILCNSEYNHLRQITRIKQFFRRGSVVWPDLSLLVPC